MAKPQIIIGGTEGYHNSNSNSHDRLVVGGTYRDLSTICITPSRGLVHMRVIQSWMAMLLPMNQKFTRITMLNMEVGEAYSCAIEQIMANPELSKWQYILTLEDDNMPPPDGLIKLYESTDKYDVVGGLYWTKGESGQPMIYGDPRVIPLNFIPQMPAPDTIVEACGLGMGFTLFKMNIFRDSRVPRPWFKTLQDHTPHVGSRAFTQDLYFFQNIARFGYRVACDTRVRVGHYDVNTDIVW